MTDEPQEEDPIIIHLNEQLEQIADELLDKLSAKKLLLHEIDVLEKKGKKVADEIALLKALKDQDKDGLL